MTCERLSSGSSLLHRTDPRVKLTVAFMLSVVTALLRNCPSQFMAFTGSLLVLASTGLPVGETLRRLALINFFLVLVAAIVPFTTPGTEVADIFSLHITREGLLLALSIWLKCNAIAALNLAFLATSTIFSLAHAMAHMRVPSKLVQLFFFSWRYIHVLEQEFRRIRNAAMLRGFRPGTSLHTYRHLAWMIGALLIKGYERGERVYNAMLCRGFNGTFWVLSHFHFHLRDGVITAAGILFAAAVIYVDLSCSCTLFS